MLNSDLVGLKRTAWNGQPEEDNPVRGSCTVTLFAWRGQPEEDSPERAVR